MKSHEIILKFDSKHQTLPVSMVDIDFTTAILSNNGIVNGQAYLLSITHQQLNTSLDLTGLTPYQVIFFDDNTNFMGASFSLGQPDHLLSIQTTANYILLIPFSNLVNLETLQKIYFTENQL